MYMYVLLPLTPAFDMFRQKEEKKKTVPFFLSDSIYYPTDNFNVVCLWHLKCGPSLSVSVVLIFTVAARACQYGVRPACRRWKGNCCKAERTMPALNHTLQTQNNPR